MTFLAELVPGDARLGGKARSLVALAVAGLPTPPGFVVTDALFRALCPELPELDRLDEAALAALDRLREQLGQQPWPAGFREELCARLAALPAEPRGEPPGFAGREPSREAERSERGGGGCVGASGRETLPGLPCQRFAVRSSFAGEDRPGRLAAGVYESRVGVPEGGVEDAIRAVLGSALAPGAVAYALAHGDAPASGPLAVLVHAYVEGEAEGSAAFAPGRKDARSEPLITVRRGSLPAEARAAIHATLAALADTYGPVEIEWVLAQGRVLYLQARPYEPPPLPAAWAGFTELGDPELRDLWHWDEAHNPLPLSPAQAGLVELCDGSCRIGIRQRVLGGYLFYAADDRPLPPAIPCEAAEAFFASLRAEVEERLARLGESPGLAEALQLFVDAYQPIFGVLQPALRAAHARLREFLEVHAPPGLALLPVLRASVPSIASERLALAGRIAAAETALARAGALADYLARFGDEAPGWDVALPTRGEAPGPLLGERRQAPRPGADWQRASGEVESQLGAGARATWRELLGSARAAVALGEADDWLYAKTQAAVRRALLALGTRLCATRALADVTDVFYVPLALLREIAAGAAPPSDLVALAGEGRRAWQAATKAPPPLLRVGDGRAVRGAGTSGRALGRVRLHRPGLPPSADAVLVARTLLPTELPLVDAAALVVETGGPLDHVAAQARERGLPAVVGAKGATDLLAEGDLVLVDGDRGLVVKLR